MNKSHDSRFEGVFSRENIEIINKLNDSGYEAYFVGGVIRDTLMGISVNDVDITTSATPDEVILVFKDYKVLPTGIDHGTVTVLYGKEAIEITTFRVDGDYSDNRRPDGVEYTRSIGEDLARRDFTVNAFAYNHSSGLVDLYGGEEDIANKTIRTVGNPDERFQEDALRIMRGLRFASKLGFTIEDETEKSMFRNKDLLSNISAERLQSELNGILLGEYVEDVMVKYASIISVFIPEIKKMIGFDQNNPYHIYDVYEHSIKVVKYANDDITHKLAGLFHDIGKPDTMTINDKGVSNYLRHAEASVKITSKILNRLRYSNAVKSKVLRLIDDHTKTLSTKEYKIKKMLYEEKPEYFFELLDFNRADDKGKDISMVSNRNEKHDKIASFAKEYLSNEPILSHKDLDITAYDLMEIGLAGKDIGEALNKLVLITLNGLPNNKKAQIEYVKNHILGK